MKRYFSSKIKWISYEEGGRKMIPPEGTRYCPLIRIKNQNSFQDWSIDFICPNFAKKEIIKFCFLAENAPVEIIKLGNTYSIYEGSKRVAILEILS